MMPFVDLPPQIEERVVCSISAAVKYEIPANIVLAVAEKEGGTPGQRVRNSNGTHDVGAMQFNTRYLEDLAKYGITAEDVAMAGCYPYDLAAWRLRGHLLNDNGDLWTRAANYHSRTPEHNARYRADLMAKADKWATWLDEHFKTVSYTVDGIPASRIEESSEAAAVVKQADSQRSTRPRTGAMTRSEFVRSGYVPRQLIINSGE